MYDCTDAAKSLIYKALVRPCLEYGCTVWFPHTTKNIILLESVQRIELLNGLRVDMTPLCTGGVRTLMTA